MTEQQQEHTATPAPSGLVPAGVFRHAAERTLTGGVCCWLLALAAGWFKIPPLFLAAVLGVAGVLAAVSVVMHYGSARLGAYTAAWALLAAGWVPYAYHAGVYHWRSAALLIVPLLVLAPAGALTWGGYLRRLREQDEADEASKEVRRLRSWDATFKAAGVTGVRAVTIVEGRAGPEIEVELTAPTTLATLSAPHVLDAICVKRRLRLGAVTVTAAASRRAHRAVVHVDTEDVLAVDLPFPEPVPGFYTTIRAIQTLGKAQNGDAVDVLLREVHAMIVGLTRSGKSNLINVLIAVMVYCTDCLVWMADFKGGRTAAPWVKPWLDGKCEHPALDWVATTRDEAERMFRAFDAWCAARDESLIGGTKLHPDRDHPQVVMIVDESADITASQQPAELERGGGASNRVMTALTDRLAAKGAASAMMLIMAYQRATADKTGRSSIKSNMGLRFALGVASEDDAKSVIPNDWKAAKLLASLVHKGAMLVWLPGRKAPLPARAFRLDNDPQEHPGDVAKIERIVIAASPLRPRPEQLALDVMGDDYEGRWDRSGLARVLRPDLPPVPGAQEPQPAPGQVVTRERPEPAPLSKASADAEFMRVLREAGELDGADDPASADDQSAQQIMLSCIRRYPATGLSHEELTQYLADAGHKPTRTTIYKWLRKFTDQGHITVRQHEGRNRYYPAGGN